MINLVKQEFVKLGKKKTIQIALLILALFVGCILMFYKAMTMDEIIYSYCYYDDLVYNDDVSNYSSVPNNTEEYATYLALTEIKQLQQNTSSEFIYLTDTYVYPELLNAYIFKYVEMNDSMYNYYYNLALTYLDYINNGNLTTFYNNEINNYQELINNSTTDLERDYYTSLKDLATYRMNNNIAYSCSDSKNNILISLESLLTEVYYYDLNYDNLTQDEKEIYQNVKETIAFYYYELDNNIDLEESSLYENILNSFSTVDLGIIIFIIVLASSIIADEFNKRTIKNLLVKPFKRTEILISKYLTILLLIPILIIFAYIIFILVGGLLFDFNSLSMPVFIYDLTNNTLITKNIFIYILQIIIAKMPMYIIIATFAFLIATITESSATATISTLILDIGLSFTMTNLKNPLIFLINYHWDLSYLVTKTSDYYNLWISLGIIALYIVIFLLIAIYNFRKKDIVNN